MAVSSGKQGSGKRSGEEPKALDDTIKAREEAPAVDLANSQTVAAASGDDEPAVRPTLPIDRYRIGNELGRGGMGRVVEAYDVQLGRNVALKEVLTKGTHRRFAREIHITARLEHASIVPLYDSGINSEGKPFYVMRKVTGKPLDEVVARCRDLDERLTILPRVLQAIEAIAHAHTRDVIHRDIKPQNILCGELGETVVIDWGLAKVIGENDDDMPIDTQIPSAADSLRTQVGSVFGTPGFMAPEQARGEALDTQGDVYALGATLYQLLSGEPPVRGVSATEVMDKTRTHDIRPLAETAPGAPPDLVAIVGKALAFDPANRYKNAGELGEDVRRFLDGQLVAAHEYTRWQKITRFARRHRGVLGVTALASVAVAVMAWIGVHRIISERDAATEARHEADVGKREAEIERDKAADRADALTVTQARAQLELDPTESLATLKQLSSTSPRRDEARAIAQGAAVRGPAWAMQTTPTLTMQADLAPDGRLLVQVSRDGMVRVYDLDQRKLVASRSFAAFSRADWIANNRLVVVHGKSAPQIWDPLAGTIEQLAADPVARTTATASGDRAILLTEDHKALMLDGKTGQLAPLAFPEPVKEVAFGDDGSWYALAGATSIVVYDKAGVEVTRKEAKVLFISGSSARTLTAMLDDKTNKIFECVLDPPGGGPTPTWTEIVVPTPPIWFIYRGRELSIFLRNGDIMGWRGKSVFRRSHFDRLGSNMREGADDVLLYLRDDGKLQWSTDLGDGAFVLPTVSANNRIASRRGVPRVAIVGEGAIQVFDLGIVLPRKLPTNQYQKGVFVDDDTLLLIGNVGVPWQWFDIKTNKLTPFDGNYRGLMLALVWDIDNREGRVLIREQTTTNGGRFILARKGSTKLEVIAESDKPPWARLVPGNAVIYGLGDAQVFAKVGDEPSKMVAKVDGISHQGAGIGPMQYAVHSTTGEVIRGDLRTSNIERTRVPMGSGGFVTSDGNGHVLIIEDNRLLIWDGQVSEIAKFDREIERVTAVEGGVAIQVGRDAQIYVLELTAGAKPHRVIAASSAPPAITNKLLVGLGNGQQITLVELPSRARWTLPPLTRAREWIDLSPNGRLLLQHTDAGLALWTIPRIGTDFAAWLDDRTNAAIDKDGVLAWPWQKP